MTIDESRRAHHERNAQMIEKFYANKGDVPSRVVQGLGLILVHTRGAKTGTVRIVPLRCRPVGTGFAVFATASGETHDPDWYRNLVAHPDVTVEVGEEKFEATARVLEGKEREELWATQKRDYPIFVDYEKTANRFIPIVLFERR